MERERDAPMTMLALERPHPLVMAGVAAAFLAAIFVPMALYGLVDADEGIYLLNARLVGEGQLPYRDFHYPQMPLLPFVYAGWMKLTGVSWYGGRLLSTLFAVGLGLALYHHVLHVTRRRGWALLAVLLLVFNALAFSWYPLVKTYAFGTLALFLAYALIDTGPARWKYVMSGLLLGLAVDTRLYVAAVVPVFALAALRERHRALELGRLAAGLAVGLAPTVYFVVIDPENFFFNVVGHHAIRSDAGLVGDFGQKREIALAMLSVSDAFDPASFQFTVLLLAVAGLVARVLVRKERVPLSVPMAAVLMVASLVPTPTYAQYFCMVLPFVITDAVRLVAQVAEEVERTAAGALARRARWALGATLVLYVLVTPLAVYSFTIGAGTQDLGLSAESEVRSARNWSIAAITQVSRAIDEELPEPGAVAISWWPGYFVESRARIFPRLENPHALWFSLRLPPETVRRHGFIDPAELVATIRAHTVPVVVLGNWLFGARAYFRDVLVASGYVPVRQLGDTEIYRWRPATR